MLARNETIFKWFLYGAAAALCFLIQGTVLQRLEFWGVIPFLYPLAAAIPATRERPASGTVFAICVGVACDLLVPGPIPCFYTMIFPLAALAAGILSQSVLRPGALCALVSAAIAFFLMDGFHCVLLWMTGKAAWEAGAYLGMREFLVTAPLALPTSLLFRTVHRRTAESHVVYDR